MPLYEYACRSCGVRQELMRRVSERLSGPGCASCGAESTALVMSVPGMVGATASAGGAKADACEMGPRCCGGGCFN